MPTFVMVCAPNYLHCAPNVCGSQGKGIQESKLYSCVSKIYTVYIYMFTEKQAVCEALIIPLLQNIPNIIMYTNTNRQHIYIFTDGFIFTHIQSVAARS